MALYCMDQLRSTWHKVCSTSVFALTLHEGGSCTKGSLYGALYRRRLTGKILSAYAFVSYISLCKCKCKCVCCLLARAVGSV